MIQSTSNTVIESIYLRILGSVVPAQLHQNVQDLASAINGTPQMNALAVDPDGDSIEMPTHIRTRVRTS